MCKYQIVEMRSNEFNAFSKAPQDVSQIVESCGFRSIIVNESACKSFLGKICAKLYKIKKLVSILLTVQVKSLIFIQSPCFFMQSKMGVFALKLLKRIKKVKIITLVHDADEFRYAKRELVQGTCTIQPLIGLAEKIIVHNSHMLDWYKSMGIDSSRLLTLGLFDYLSTGRKVDDGIQILDSHTVVITSNLNPKAAVYLKYIKTYNNIKWELFGPNFSEQDIGGPNVRYNGLLNADELPGKLPSGFGLVWYGDSKKSCNCYFKEYLKIINPHKTSAYLASGLPVIVWKDIGVADFVRSNGVGLCVDSLDDIEKKLSMLTAEELKKMQLAVNEISQKLRNGYYTTKAIEKCLASIMDMSECK
jgi:hypothetical protein